MASPNGKGNSQLADLWPGEDGCAATEKHERRSADKLGDELLHGVTPQGFSGTPMLRETKANATNIGGSFARPKR